MRGCVLCRVHPVPPTSQGKIRRELPLYKLRGLQKGKTQKKSREGAAAADQTVFTIQLSTGISWTWEAGRPCGSAKCKFQTDTLAGVVIITNLYYIKSLNFTRTSNRPLNFYPFGKVTGSTGTSGTGRLCCRPCGRGTRLSLVPFDQRGASV